MGRSRKDALADARISCSERSLHAYNAAFQDGEPLIAYCAGPAHRHSQGQRLCQRCNLHALHDERHLVLECPAMQCVRDQYPALFSPAQNTMQLFMWQRNMWR